MTVLLLPFYGAEYKTQITKQHKKSDAKDVKQLYFAPL